MKNLANCTPIEFLKQTNRIKKSAERWLDATNIIGIRSQTAEPAKITNGMSKEEKRAALEDFKKRSKEQAMKNLSEIYDAISEKDPEGTLELLALLCFEEPENVNAHPIKEYLSCIGEMLSDESVIDFFTSLMLWGQKIT